MSGRDWRPAYVQLAENIRDKIANGTLRPGDLLPSENELAEQERLSRTTVRQAFRLLRSWGQVDSQRGKGTFVRHPRTRTTRFATQRYQWEKDRVRKTQEERLSNGASEQDTGLAFEDIEFYAKFDKIEADARLAELFEIEIGSPLLRRKYSNKNVHTGLTIGYHVSHIPYRFAVKNPELLDSNMEPWPGGTQHQLFTVGVELSRIDDTITTRPAGPEDVELFALDEGAAIIEILKISVSTDNEVVDVAQITTPGETTTLKYSTPLESWT